MEKREQELYDKIKEIVKNEPLMMELTIIVMALRHLEQGKPIRDVLYSMEVDFDKLCGDEAENAFGDYCKHVAECLHTADRIRHVNETTNHGRGSSVARSMLTYLERYDLDSARNIFGIDGDKVFQYPELMRTIERSAIGCRMHGRPHYCWECAELDRED